MTVEVNELQRGTAERGRKSRNYTRVFQVIADNILDPTSASFSVPVALGNLHPNDALAECKNISARLMSDNDHRSVFLVTCKYETGSGGTDEPEEQEDPVQDHPVISWGSRTVRLPVTQTSDDPPKAITNSADEPFDPPPEEDFHVLTYSYTVNVLAFDPNDANLFRGAINDSAFTLAGLQLEKYQARCQSISASNGERNGIRFWRVTFEIEVADDWRLLLQDMGFRKKDPVEFGDPRYTGNGDFVYAPILDTRGLPVTTPIPLDGDGNPLPEGADPVFLDFHTVAKPLRDFKKLGLPTNNTP